MHPNGVPRFWNETTSRLKKDSYHSNGNIGIRANTERSISFWDRRFKKFKNFLGRLFLVPKLTIPTSVEEEFFDITKISVPKLIFVVVPWRPFLAYSLASLELHGF